MPSVVRLASGGAPEALGAGERAGLLQQAVQGGLDDPPHELAQVGLQALLARCYDGLGHGLPQV